MDAHSILGIPRNADMDEIKRGYRQAALRWHPDKNPNDRKHAEKRFKEIALAYETLSKSHTCCTMTSSVQSFDVESAYKLFESVFEQHPDAGPACEAAEALLAEMQSLDFAEAMFQFCQAKIKEIQQTEMTKKDSSEDLASTSAGSSHSSPRSSEHSSPSIPTASSRMPGEAAESCPLYSRPAWKVTSFKEIIQQLKHEDPGCILVVRGIQKLGFESGEKLVKFFGTDGALREVLISHKHVKAKGSMRMRPASTGFIIMRHEQSVDQFLASGDELSILGACVKIQKFGSCNGIQMG
jgi:hypothetical protein